MDNDTAWGQLDGRNLPVRYWLQGQPTQNFGDFLTELFLARLFLPYGMKARAFHIIGSCIDDIFFDQIIKEGDVDTPQDFASRRVIFWGCGIRKPGSLSEENRRRADILAVRGPRTRSALRLGDSIPLGDPALFLPAIYKPVGAPSGKSVCVPHFTDQRSDAEIIELSGCDSIIRPNLPNNPDNLLQFIDGIVASDFVLASSFHGALVAAAYQRPFAFWDSGHVDLPFKWEDFAELVSIPCRFAKSLKEATELYQTEILPNYTHPRLWPLLAAAPLAVRPDALIRILRYDLRIHGTNDLDEELNQRLSDLSRFQAGRGRFHDYFGQAPLSKLRALRLKLSARQEEIKNLTEVLERQIANLTEVLSERDRQIANLTEVLSERDRQIEGLRTDVEKITETTNKLAQTIEDRDSEIKQWGARQAETNKLLEQTKIQRETLEQELAIKTLALSRLNIKLKHAIDEAQGLQRSNVWRYINAFRKIKHGLAFFLSVFGWASRDLFRRNLAHPFRISKEAWRLAKSALMISRSGIFDSDRYLEQNKDVAISRIDPILHYVSNGAYEGRDPNSLFDSAWYLQQYPDVAQAGINPLVHYIQSGAYEGRDPNALFDSDWYLRKYADLAQAGINPLAHYMKDGAYEGRDPNALFDSDWYLQRYPDVAQSGDNPLAHYIAFGANEGRNPNPLFDGAWYLQRYPDVAHSGINPLVHYIHFGAREGRDPNPYFDSDWYLQQNPDIAESRTNPLAHYIHNGAAERRNPSPAFDTNWYLAQNSDAAVLGINPLKHFFSAGILEGRLPKPPAPGESIDRVELTLEAGHPKILFIDSIYPRPDRDSGSIDTINYIRLFREFGYQVIFAADAEFNLDHDIHQPLEDDGVICLRAFNYASISRFIELEGKGLAASFLSRVHCGGRYYEKIRAINPANRIIFNTVDLHGIREEREARLKQDFRAMNLALRTSERERYLGRQCDATVVVSKVEKQWLESEAPGARVLHIPLMRDCPGRQRGFEEREGVCFVGSFLHTPNIDAVQYFLDSIWPLVREKMPSCIFYIVGADLPDEIASRKDLNVEILGHVPDLRDLFEKMRLSVAPLRFGAGAKGKVVSSLANGLPCVATGLAAEGMNLQDGLHVAIENDPASFANRITQIYNDREAWTRLSDGGCEFCSSEFSLNVGRERMAELFEKLKLPVANSLGAPADSRHIVAAAGEL
jgi:glycosyltransferase involved in cell wall biosynthesis